MKHSLLLAALLAMISCNDPAPVVPPAPDPDPEPEVGYILCTDSPVPIPVASIAALGNSGLIQIFRKGSNEVVDYINLADLEKVTRRASDGAMKSNSKPNSPIRRASLRYARTAAAISARSRRLSPTRANSVKALK